MGKEKEVKCECGKVHRIALGDVYEDVACKCGAVTRFYYDGRELKIIAKPVIMEIVVKDG